MWNNLFGELIFDKLSNDKTKQNMMNKAPLVFSAL